MQFSVWGKYINFSDGNRVEFKPEYIMLKEFVFFLRFSGRMMGFKFKYTASLLANPYPLIVCDYFPAHW